MLFFDFFICLVEYIISLDFISCFLPAKPRPLPARGILFLGAAALLSGITSIAPLWIVPFAAIAIMLVLLSLLTESSWQHRLLLALFSMGLSALCEFAAAYLLSLFLRIPLSLTMEKEYGYFVVALISKSLFFLLTELTRIGLNRSPRPSFEHGFQPVVLFPAASGAVLYFAFYIDPWLPRNTWYSFFSAGVCILLLVANLALFYDWNRRQKATRAWLAAIAAQRSQEEQKKVIELQNRYLEELSMLTHDYKNQMIAMTGLLREGENPLLEEQLRKISGSMNERYLAARRYTSNGAVNGILAAKGEECRQRGIAYTVQAEGGALDFLNYEDACAIFGNALDNAIEECQRLSGREDLFIRVIISRQWNLVSLYFENSRDPDHEVKFSRSGLPITTKESAPFHGYGLLNLKQAVERYQGTVFFEVSPGSFVLKILLTDPKTEDEQ